MELQDEREIASAYAEWPFSARRRQRRLTLCQCLEFCDAAGGDPFGDEDVAVVVEAGVVGVDEFSGSGGPAVGLAAHFVAVLGHFTSPRGVFA